MYWLGSVRTLIWWRNQVVAPLSEEWTFRACMLPLLLQCFTPATAIFVCPLFFGVAHFHHVVERVKMGMGIRHALFISCKSLTTPCRPPDAVTIIMSFLLETITAIESSVIPPQTKYPQRFIYGMLFPTTQCKIRCVIPSLLFLGC